MTSAPAVRTALVDLFTALGSVTVDGTTYTVQVVRAPGAVTTLAPILIMIGKITGTRSAGSHNRIRNTTRNIPFGTSQDEYTVEIFTSVSLAGNDIELVEDIGDAIFEAARNAVESSGNLNIAGVVFEALPTGEFTVDPTGDGNGRYVTIAWGIDVTARD